MDPSLASHSFLHFGEKSRKPDLPLKKHCWINFNHSDWLLKMHNQSECIKRTQHKLMLQLLSTYGQHSTLACYASCLCFKGKCSTPVLTESLYFAAISGHLIRSCHFTQLKVFLAVKQKGLSLAWGLLASCYSLIVNVGDLWLIL